MPKRKALQAGGAMARRGPSASFESRTRTASGVVAISTQFEPSPLYVDFRQLVICTMGSLQSSWEQR